MAGDGEAEIGNEAEHVGKQNEHEQREHQREKHHPLWARGVAQRIGNEGVEQFGSHLQTPRYYRPAARCPQEENRDRRHRQHHEQRGIGKGDVEGTDLDGWEQILNLKLVDWIHRCLALSAIPSERAPTGSNSVRPPLRRRGCRFHSVWRSWWS